MAHKKGQGSSRNGRDSNGQRRGVKRFAGQVVPAGNILVQAMGAGELANLGEVRAVVRNSFELTTIEPRPSKEWERAYQRFRGKNIGLTDVLRPKSNVVILWANHPSDTAEQTIQECLK